MNFWWYELDIKKIIKKIWDTHAPVEEEQEVKMLEISNLQNKPLNEIWAIESLSYRNVHESSSESL